MKRGIVLMNLGSPDSTSVSDVRRYLNEFLMDKRVIDVPWLSRLLLVRGIIVPFRAPKSAAAYRSIWTDEGSPLIVLTRQLEAAVQEGMHDPVTIAMRYGNPSPRQAYEELLRREPSLEEVLVIPLYPHFAMSSYETAAEYAKEQYAEGGYGFRLRVLRPYYNDPAYIDALAASIRPYLNSDHDHILFSYHGVPERHITQNDPAGTHHLLSPDACCQSPGIQATCYRYQCLHTTQQVAEELQLAPGRFSISFQSRLGREEWLKPYTAVRLAQMPAEGIRKLLVVCPAFVSDCLETLEEIAVEGREIFLHAGGEAFTMIPCLNLHPKWVEALRGYISEPQTAEA